MSNAKARGAPNARARLESMVRGLVSRAPFIRSELQCAPRGLSVRRGAFTAWRRTRAVRTDDASARREWRALPDELRRIFQAEFTRLREAQRLEKERDTGESSNAMIRKYGMLATRKYIEWCLNQKYAVAWNAATKRCHFLQLTKKYRMFKESRTLRSIIEMVKADKKALNQNQMLHLKNRLRRGKESRPIKDAHHHPPKKERSSRLEMPQQTSRSGASWQRAAR